MQEAYRGCSYSFFTHLIQSCAADFAAFGTAVLSLLFFVLHSASAKQKTVNREYHAAAGKFSYGAAKLHLHKQHLTTIQRGAMLKANLIGSSGQGVIPDRWYSPRARIARMSR